MLQSKQKVDISVSYLFRIEVVPILTIVLYPTPLATIIPWNPLHSLLIRFKFEIGLPLLIFIPVSNLVFFCLDVALDGDKQSFTAAERELFEKYGKVPTHKSLLGNKLKVSANEFWRINLKKKNITNQQGLSPPFLLLY